MTHDPQRLRGSKIAMIVSMVAAVPTAILVGFGEITTAQKAVLWAIIAATVLILAVVLFFAQRKSRQIERSDQ